jgi:hypothetical protein
VVKSTKHFLTRYRPQILLQHGHKSLDLYTTSRRSRSFSSYPAASCLPYLLFSRSVHTKPSVQLESRRSIRSTSCCIQLIPIKCSVQSIPTTRPAHIQLHCSLPRATTPTPASRPPEAQRSNYELQTMGRRIHQARPALRPQPRHQREFLEVS